METTSAHHAQKLPKWVLILVGFLGLLALFVGISLYVSPATFVTDVDFNVPAHRTLVLMWAARQVAIAVAILVSLLLRRKEMLWMALFTYSLMTLQDAAVGLFIKDTSLAAGSGFFCGLSVLLLWKLWRLTFSLPTRAHQ